MLVDGRHHLTAELLLMISYVSALHYVLRYVDDIGGSYELRPAINRQAPRVI